jgi:hypothetical protein
MSSPAGGGPFAHPRPRRGRTGGRTCGRGQPPLHAPGVPPTLAAMSIVAGKSSRNDPIADARPHAHRWARSHESWVGLLRFDTYSFRPVVHAIRQTRHAAQAAVPRVQPARAADHGEAS